METTTDDRTGQWGQQFRAAGGQALQLQTISEQRQASGTEGSQWASLSIPELKITRHVREDQLPTEVIETEIEHRTGQWDLQSTAAEGQALQLQSTSEQRQASGIDVSQWARISIPGEVKITGHVWEDQPPTDIAPKGFQAHKHLISFAGRFHCAIAKRLCAFVGSL